MEYVGNRWHKCDLHLHTTLSSCFKDKSVTNEQWIERVVEQNLNCIAVTDHNDYRNIDALMELGRKNGIVVFPGVEVTCDTTKMHLLVFFDINMGGDVVRDFLCKVNIDGKNVGKCVGTSFSIFDVCKKAKEMGAVVIASHIDDFNGINMMDSQCLEKIFDENYLDGVEIVNAHIWEKHWEEKSEMLNVITQMHGTQIPESDVERWRKTYMMAKRKKIPMICFSDNPSAEGEATHGLWGVGSHYTWIKMKQIPDLESFRQALLGSDARIKTYLESPCIPEKNPAFWVKSLSIEKSVLNPYVPFVIEFNPHFNCIIGENGSGKSSILRLIAGVLGIWTDDSINEIQQAQRDFYCRNTEEHQQGVFYKDTKMTMEICWNDILYKIEVCDVISMEEQKIKVFRYVEKESMWEYIGEKECLKHFKIQAYMQKQVYEMTKNPTAVIAVLDSLIDNMEPLLSKRKAIAKKYVSFPSKREDRGGVLKEEKRKMYNEYYDCICKINRMRKKAIKKMTGEQTELLLFVKANVCFDRDGNRLEVPEDEAEACFLMINKKCKPFSALALWQKAEIVLRIILSNGSSPLLFDQPEDELSNRFVYQFIVERLKQCKQNRQIIIATNSPNIVVNGEPDYIISFGQSREYVKLPCAGSMDKAEIRKEICEIVEGTECAFQKRVEKYHISSVL